MTTPCRVIALDTVGSTNDEAAARLREGERPPFAVTALTQTVGRGRHGRSWISPPGNLYLSLGLVDPAPAAKAPQLGFVAGIAIAETLRARLGGDTRVRLKWPNDILCDGAKLAGMLLEGLMLPDGRLGCVIGLGVNCRSNPRDLAYPATNLRAAGDEDGTSDIVLAEFLERFDMHARAWNGGVGFPAIRSKWLSMAAGLDTRIAVATPRTRLDGTFRDLDATGRMMLDTADGLVAIDAGDVFFPALAAADG